MYYLNYKTGELIKSDKPIKAGLSFNGIEPISREAFERFQNIELEDVPEWNTPLKILVKKIIKFRSMQP